MAPAAAAAALASGSSSIAQLASTKKLLREKEAEIALLQERCSGLSRQLQSTLFASAEKKRRPHHPLSPHAINVREVTLPNHNGGGGGVGGDSKRMIHSQRERIGRTASIATRRVLDSLVAMQQHQQQHSSSSVSSHQSRLADVVRRIRDMFQHPTQHMEYLNSNDFAKDLLKLCKAVKGILENEPRVVFMQSPCYVFGDIHGNLEDLHFFSDNIWRLGMSLTAGNFLFLGDYVDRGLNCLETVAYLLAMKLELPNKVFLLRGNHETRDVNGWEEHYAERSFIWQCRSRFGDDLGYRLWEACNAVFDRLPLAAVIDQDIFCVHGGIPRPVCDDTTRIQDILTVSKVAGINPPYEHEDDRYQQVASDCIWSDPASEEQEMHSVDPDTGFGESLRGGGAICFGSKAVTDFLSQQDFSYIMRAHEAHADGVAVSKGARVFTVFSTSQDHNQGSQAMAGCLLVDNEKLQVINRSPAYKNQYVHRRDSVSLSSLSEQEIQKRIKLGLVTNLPMGGGGMAVTDDVELDDWQDIPDEGKGDSDSSVDDFTIDTKRRSSVDLDNMSFNSHDQECEAPVASTVTAGIPFSFHSDTYDPNKRLRARKPMVASIQEESPPGAATASSLDDEEIATVDGDNDDDMDIFRQANGC